MPVSCSNICLIVVVYGLYVLYNVYAYVGDLYTHTTMCSDIRQRSVPIHSSFSTFRSFAFRSTQSRCKSSASYFFCVCLIFATTLSTDARAAHECPHAFVIYRISSNRSWGLTANAIWYVPVRDYGIQKFKKAKKLVLKNKIIEAGKPAGSNRSRVSNRSRGGGLTVLF